MMAYSEDHIALAAEYALGTLDADERAQVETMMAVDTEFTAIVAGLGVPARRRSTRWSARSSRGRSCGRTSSRDRPFRAAGAAGAAGSAAAAAAGSCRSTPKLRRCATCRSRDSSNVIQLSGRVRRWRNVASFATRDRRRAGRDARRCRSISRICCPTALRPKPRTQVVEVKTPAPPAPPSAQYVAVLQQDGGSPAFILTVDAATKNFTVRKVGAEPEPGKSFELWLISDKLPQPRSLGVIGGSDFTARPVLSSYDANIDQRARPMR